MTNISERIPDPDPFDPTIYPQEFTPEIFRTTPVRDLLILERHLDDLSERQRTTFRSSREDVMGPLMEKIRSSFSVPKFKTFQSPEFAASMQQINDRMRARFELTERLAPTEPAPVTGSLEVALDDSSMGAIATVGELERDVDQDSELLAVMSNMRDLMERQHLSNTRGAFFAFIVSSMVIVAGVAPIVAAKNWPERFWIIGISAGLVGLAFGIYLRVRRQQIKSDTPPAQATS